MSSQPHDAVPPRAPSRLLSVAGVTACGGDDEGSRAAAPAANDSATVACRGFRTPERQTCEGSFFQCRADTAEIVDDIDVGRDPDPRTISARYAALYWEDWDAEARAAARTGCRNGLRR